MQEKLIKHCFTRVIISLLIIIIQFPGGRGKGTSPSHDVSHKGKSKITKLPKTDSGCLQLPLTSPAHPEPAHPCPEGKIQGRHLGILSDSRVTRGQGVHQVPVAPWAVAVMSKADGCVVRGEVGLHSRWALHRQRSLSCKLPPMII